MFHIFPTNPSHKFEDKLWGISTLMETFPEILPLKFQNIVNYMIVILLSVITYLREGLSIIIPEGESDLRDLIIVACALCKNVFATMF